MGVNNMEKFSDKLLLEIYNMAIKHKLGKDFIVILRVEVMKRHLL